jgi:hypothetical protein
MSYTKVSLSDVTRQVEDAVKTLIKTKLEELKKKATDDLNAEFARLALESERVFKIESVITNDLYREIRVSVVFLGVSE